MSHKKFGHEPAVLTFIGYKQTNRQFANSIYLRLLFRLSHLHPWCLFCNSCLFYLFRFVLETRFKASQILFILRSPCSPPSPPPESPSVPLSSLSTLLQISLLLDLPPLLTLSPTKFWFFLNPRTFFFLFYNVNKERNKRWARSALKAL